MPVQSVFKQLSLTMFSSPSSDEELVQEDGGWKKQDVSHSSEQQILLMGGRGWLQQIWKLVCENQLFRPFLFLINQLTQGGVPTLACSILCCSCSMLFFERLLPGSKPHQYAAIPHEGLLVNADYE